jgi:hypothetical protein
MWVPANELDLIQSVTSGSIEESPIFDAKREIPANNREIAKDIAAMANDGGVIIYGIGEDENGRLTNLNPIALNGRSERIDAIVQTAICEPPIIHVSKIPTSEDPSKGYLVVQIPASERAPHMVIVKGDHRFYGRSAKGNRLLSEAEVARLYERRQRWEVDREALLSEEIDNAPCPPHKDFAYLHVIARPVAARDGFLDQVASDTQPIQRVLSDLVETVESLNLYPIDYRPFIYNPQRWFIRTEGYLADLHGSLNRDDPGEALTLQIDFDGTGHLFCGRAAEREADRFLFFHSVVAGNTLNFIAFLGELHARAHYIGMVDIGLAVTGLSGSVLHVKNRLMSHSLLPYEGNDYRRSMRVSAISCKAEPKRLTEQILTPLFNVMTQGRVNLFS